MADVKFSDLSAISALANGDMFVATDDSEAAAEKTKSVLASVIRDFILPTSMVAPFMTEIAPTGWLECDGTAVSRGTYSTLYAVVGDTYGNGDGSTTFNLPDLRGRFLRAWDNGAGIDPDAATRTDSGDGVTTGDHVGTLQASQNKAHTHNTTISNQTGAAYGQPAGQIGNSNAVRTSTSSGGDEARPVNINVMYCIKY